MLHSSKFVLLDAYGSASFSSVHEQDAGKESTHTGFTLGAGQAQPGTSPTASGSKHANVALAFDASEDSEVVAEWPPPEPPPRLSQVRICAFSGSVSANTAVAAVPEVGKGVVARPPPEPPPWFLPPRLGARHVGLRRFPARGGRHRCTSRLAGGDLLRFCISGSVFIDFFILRIYFFPFSRLCMRGEHSRPLGLARCIWIRVEGPIY